VVVDATHGLFVGEAVERLAKLPLRRLVVTDTLGGVETHALPVEAMSIAPLLAAAIGRLHDDEPADVLLGDA
jgi:ribose-phosphate pyrophosphokinase